jgi:hypothetical protein
VKLNKQLEDVKNREAEKKYAKLSGRCFKCRNCYSLAEKPSDYWWLYCRVLRIDGVMADCIVFQIDKNGRIEVRNEQYYCEPFVSGGYQEIGVEDLIKAWEEIESAHCAFHIALFRRK